MSSFTTDLDEDLYNYLEFLERIRYIRSKGEAVRKALLLFKRLSMHEWLSHTYRIASNRIIIIYRGMLLDLFELLTENEIYRAGQHTAMKRKVLKPEFRDIKLTRKRNWSIVLKELQNLGWGSFERSGDEIKVENCAVLAEYIRGYLETMFQVLLEQFITKKEGLLIFKVAKSKK